MTPAQALHLLQTQERLELEGYRFVAIPPRPYSQKWEWLIVATHLDNPTRHDFRRPLRSDALAQALHWAEMDSATRGGERDTVPAPAMEAAE